MIEKLKTLEFAVKWILCMVCMVGVFFKAGNLDLIFILAILTLLTVLDVQSEIRKLKKKMVKKDRAV